MKNLATYFLFALLFISCESNEKAYSYLCDADTDGETIEFVYKNSDNAEPFRYTIQSQEMCIKWGYDNNLTDYIFTGKVDSITTVIKPLEHTFPSTGEYTIQIKALNMKALDLSKTNANEITELKFTNCDNLEKLSCVGQALSTLDLSTCPLLKQLSCGYDNGVLTLSDLAKLIDLQSLDIQGKTNYSEVNLSTNKKIKSVSFNNSNIAQINLNSLQLLSEVEINNCPLFNSLSLLDNVKLTQLILMNNSLLSADIINNIFDSLPSATDNNCKILIRGNLGDDLCDKAIATNKGWTFVESL